MLGIVLSGGGSKGAYEIGVWKALKKLKIKYGVVTGTSVGALNGVLMVQNDFKKAVKIWENIHYDQIVDGGTFDSNMDFVKYYTKSIVKQGGASITALEKLVDESVDIEKFYNSKINYGLITFNMSKMSPKILTKQDIKKEDLKKYIVASATCYPFFKKKKIDNDNFIDGGYFDNLPINLAISLGANEIIAVDLKAVGLKQKVKDKNVKVTYITPNNDIGNMLVFEKDLATKNIRYGYNDTLKVFKKLEGHKFSFKRKDLWKNFIKYSDKYFEIMSSLFPKEYSKITDKYKYFNNMVEKVGLLFELDESLIYNKRKYNNLLKEKLKTVKEIVNPKKGLAVYNKKEIVKYFCSLINVDNKKLSNYDLFLNEEVLMAIYLYVIK